MKKLVLSLFALCLSQLSFSQTFMQGVGINVILQSASGVSVDPVGAILYSPRVTVNESDNTSITIGIPLSAGISGSYSSMDADNSTLGFMFDAPLMFDYNYGAGATKDVEDKFGFYGGVGFGYHTNQYYATDEYGMITKARSAVSALSEMSGCGSVLATTHITSSSGSLT